jgi:ATP-binding cassette subfamily B protein/subfamily B ATP-binding cassette protein MsbA
MNNLGRALRMTLKYRWSMIGSFVCCLLVAALWGANFGAVYPFVEVVMRGKSLHQWVEDRTEESLTRIANDTAKIEAIELQIASAKDGFVEVTNNDGVAETVSVETLKQQTVVKRDDIKAEQVRIEWTEWIAPTVAKWAPKSPFMTLVWLMGFMMLGTILRGLFLMGNMVLVARVGQRTVLDLQNQVFGNVLDMEVSETGVKGTGDLVSRIRGETGTIGRAISILFGKTCREPLKMTVCIIGAAYINWRLLVFSMLICPLAGYLMITLARMTKRANKKAVEDSAKLLDRLYQALTYLRAVKTFTNEDKERERFQLVARDVYKKGMKIAFYNSLSRINSELLGVGMITLSVLAGGYLAINHQTHLFGVRMCDAPMDFGGVIAFFGCLIGVADPLRKMADVYNTIISGVVAADRVFPLIDQTPSVTSPPNPTTIPAGRLSIEFDNVEFSYVQDTDQDRRILKGLTADIPAGSSLAIIGHNGCGKSTLINLIPRFFDVENGSIRIGGHDLRDYRVKDLREKVGYVTQLTMLFNDTIAENIAYGNSTATLAEVKAAAKQAHAHDFIQELDEGYDSHIGEHGGKLSGGQRQRLSLARAILKDPEILILDEATSQIDPESEQLIHKTLAEFIKGRTTVVITHRLSTLDLVDQIMIMNDGQVVDCGTHEQLMARCHSYQRMRNLGLEGAA